MTAIASISASETKSAAAPASRPTDTVSAAAIAAAAPPIPNFSAHKEYPRMANRIIMQSFPDLLRVYRYKKLPLARLRWTSLDGVALGFFGAIFAVLGLFSFGLVFLPFAAIFSLTSSRRSRDGMSVSGACMAALSTALTLIGVAVSPTVWILIFAFVKTADVSFDDGIY